jgi:small conductance mechanosensitive channel
MSEQLETQLSSFIDFLPNLITALVVFVITLWVAGWLAKVVRRAMIARNIDKQVATLLGQVVRWIVLAFGLLTALQQVDFDVTAFVAGLGALGLAAGLALQDITQNFVAGVLLLVTRPFKPGDLVDIGGTVGHVYAVDLRATEIETLDGNNVILPNATVLGSAVNNMSKRNLKKIKVDVGVAYDSDLDKVRATALECVKPIEGYVDTPVPEILYHTFGGSSIDLTVVFWIDANKIHPLTALDRGVVAVKNAFEQAEIDIPFPIRTVYMEK